MYQILHGTVLSDGRLALDGNGYERSGSGYVLTRQGILYLDQNGAFLSAVSGSVTRLDVFNALAPASEGKVLVIGSTMGTGGATMLNSDGTRAWTATGGTSDVLRTAVQDDGKILIGGWFTQFAGAPARYLLRLNADGTVDSSFVPPANLQSGVTAIAPGHNAKIYVGMGAGGIARLNSDGTNDLSWQPTYFNSVYALLVQPDDRVLALAYDNSSAASGLFRYRTDGFFDNTFVEFGIWQPLAAYNSLAMRDNGQLLATGANFAQTTLSPNHNLSRLGLASFFRARPRAQSTFPTNGT
jgi:uncharacterized delta-60 repeat protein